MAKEEVEQIEELSLDIQSVQTVQAYRFDMETGIFIETVDVDPDNIPEDCTLKIWKEPCYTPKWDFDKKEWGDTGQPTIVIIEE